MPEVSKKELERVVSCTLFENGEDESESSEEDND